MGLWAIAKKYLNSTIGTPDAQALDKIIEEKLNWLRRYVAEGNTSFKKFEKTVNPTSYTAEGGTTVFSTEQVVFDREGYLNVVMSVNHTMNGSYGQTLTVGHLITVSDETGEVATFTANLNTNYSSSINETKTVKIRILPDKVYTVSSRFIANLNIGGGSVTSSITHKVDFQGDLVL